MHNFRSENSISSNNLDWSMLFWFSLAGNFSLIFFIYQQKLIIERLVVELGNTNERVNELNLLILKMERSLIENPLSNGYLISDVLIPNFSNITPLIFTLVSTYFIYSKASSSLSFIADWKNYVEFLPFGSYIKTFFVKQELVIFTDSVHDFRLVLLDGVLKSIEILNKDTSDYEKISEYLIKLTRSSNDFKPIQDICALEINPESLEAATNIILSAF